MRRLIPLETFEHDTHPVILVNTAGRLSFINRAAAALVKCSPEGVLGSPCWQIMRLRTMEGGPFCSPDCPILRECRAGTLEPRHTAILRSNGRDPLPLDMSTFLIPPRHSNRPALLHLLKPGPPLQANPSEPACGSALRAQDRLYLLSNREKEILGWLARGKDSQDIADQLFISPFTARHHIQSILSKLGVHRRIEAVLALFGKDH